MDSDDDSSIAVGGRGGERHVSPEFQRQYRTDRAGDRGDDDPRSYPMATGGNSSGGGASSRLAELQEEVARLRECLSCTNQGTVEANYLTSLKRNRELNVKLESEKSKIVKLQNRIVQLEKEKMDAEDLSRKGVLLPSQKSPSKASGSTTFGERDANDLAETQRELNEWKEKAERQGQLSATLRKQNDELKREVARMKRIVQQEVGDEALVAKALNANSGGTAEGDGDSASGNVGTPLTSAAIANSSGATWRGRAQQIAVLKTKVKDLERWKAESIQGTVVGDGNDVGNPDDLTSVAGGPSAGGAMSIAPSSIPARSVAGTVRTVASTRRDFDDVNRIGIERKEGEKKLEVIELKKQLTTKETEAEKERMRAESLNARLTILERDNQHLKVCISRVVEKTESDDKLIQTYKTELEEKNKELRRLQVGSGSGHAISGRRANPGGAGGSGPSERELSLEREVSRLTRTISELQNALLQREANASAAKPAPTTGGSNSLLSNDDRALTELAQLVQADPSGALGKAVQLVERQRRTLIAVNRQLSDYENRTTKLLQSPAGSDLAVMTREENLNLKERLKSLTEVMDREIDLHKQLAAGGGGTSGGVSSGFGQGRTGSGNGSNASRGSTPITTKPPLPIAGRRASAGSERENGGSRPNSAVDSGASVDVASDDARVAAMQQELQAVKQQYAELRNAYNSQQLSQNRVSKGTPTTGNPDKGFSGVA